MSKTSKFLDELNDDELTSFEKDIRDGTIQKFIDQKKEYFKIKDKACASCGNNVGEDCFVLIYGDPKTAFRKKAHFCGSDCMEYFVKKNIRKEKVEVSADKERSKIKKGPEKR